MKKFAQNLIEKFKATLNGDETIELPKPKLNRHQRRAMQVMQRKTLKKYLKKVKYGETK